jgi:ribosomal protein S18 acetylase RimI-like enzyme
VYSTMTKRIDEETMIPDAAAGPALELTDQPDSAIRGWVLAGLTASNRAYVGEPGLLNLAAVIRERAHGEILGGLLGRTAWEWLRIEFLYVAPAWRRAGWGTRLVRAAEKEAVKRLCRSAWVDSYSFQAPDFYERLGYTIFGSLDDYPAGHRRYFLQRRLIGAADTPSIVNSHA